MTELFLDGCFPVDSCLSCSGWLVYCGGPWDLSGPVQPAFLWVTGLTLFQHLEKKTLSPNFAQCFL
jgi:hypothetical protein